MKLLRSSRKSILIYGGIFCFLLIWQWNGLVYGLWTGFDMGVQNMELFTTISDELHYGKDLLVTPYLPLSSLYKGVVLALTGGYREAVFQTVAINLFSAFLRVFVISLFWENAKSRISKWIAALVTILIFLKTFVQRGPTQLDLCILVASLLICKLYCSCKDLSKAKLCYMVVVIGVLLAVPQLAKFSYFAMAMALIIILCVVLLVYKRYVETGMLLGTYIAATMLLWMLSGEKVQYLLPCLKAMLYFTSGYSEVMALPFSAYENAFSDFVFAIAVCCGYAAILLYLLFRNRSKAVSWFIIAPFIFLMFKEAFVRSDQHTLAFNESLIYIFCYILFFFQYEEDDINCRKVLAFARRACCVVVMLLLLPQIVNGAWQPKTTLCADFEKLRNEDQYEAEVASNKYTVQMMEEYKALYHDVEPYPGSTLGMLSGEQTFFIAYDLMDRFKLNPIVSLWENFTPYSEQVAREQYYGADAPDILLYRPESLDNGYFIFRMGTILQPLLENYHCEKVDDYGYLVLKKNGESKRETADMGEPVRVSIGETIAVPEAENAHVFMKVNWDLTALGKLASFVLKPTQTQVQITTASGSVYTYRFFRTLAENGLYVSSIVGWSQDLAHLINGDREYDPITSIKFLGSKLFYKKDFQISFYAVPHRENSIITVKFAHEIPAGNYEFSYAQDDAFNEWNKVSYAIDNGTTEVTGEISPIGWNTLRLDFPSQAAEYDILSITCDGKNVVIDGVNDAQYEEKGDGWHISTGDYDPFITFHLLE